jgi:FkbM family methyltransferase
MKSYSQYYQDFFIDILFAKKQKGTFLDIGAHDGVSLSNTYLFEKHRNWNGICIEPNPSVFEKLQVNRNCVVKNCCISNKEGNIIFRKVNGYPEMLSGILDFFDEKHIERINREITLHDGSSYVDIEVKSENINRILDENHIYEIDYCSIDTEGAEFEIVKSIDFEKYHINSFSIENTNHDHIVRDFLKAKGYIFIISLNDDFYVKSPPPLVFP